MANDYVLWLEELGSGDVGRVGGKNASLGKATRKARVSGTTIGVPGQGPSNHPEFAAFLVEEGIDTISLDPDSFVDVARHVAEAEQRLRCGARAGMPEAAAHACSRAPWRQR